jgi:hypothetical protein
MADDSSRASETTGARFGPPSAKVQVREASGDSGSASRPLDGAWSASNRLSVGGGWQWNRRLGVEFKEAVGAVLYIGESYVVMCRDCSTDLNMLLIHPWKISFEFWKGDKTDLGTLRF